LGIQREPLSASSDTGGRQDAEVVRSSGVLTRGQSISGLSQKIKTWMHFAHNLAFSILPLTPMSGMVLPLEDEYSLFVEHCLIEYCPA
jgi:hypothetical protein